MFVRAMAKSRIADGCIEEYLRIHNEIGPEVFEEYRRVGVKSLSCFVDGNDLYVYTEYDDAFDAMKTDDNMPLNAVIQRALAPTKDPAVPRRALTKVFHME